MDYYWGKYIMSVITLRGVTHAYPARPQPLISVRDVSFEVGKGEFVAIIGASGCGKSTLLRLIAALLRPTSGVITLDGAPPTPGSTAYMPQDNTLLPWRTVLDNVVLGAEIQRRRAHGIARARELLPMFGLDGFADAYPAELSGGMRQRAAFLRTFLMEKQIVLLDEPLGALDALTRRGLQTWLHELWMYFGYTVVLVTHDIHEAVYLADRVVVMLPRPGRVGAVVDVPLPRPRRHTDLEFAAQVVQIESLLEDAASFSA